MKESLKEFIEKYPPFMFFLRRSFLFVLMLVAEIFLLTNLVDFQNVDLTTFYIYTPLHFILFLFILVFAVVSFRKLLKIDYLEEIEHMQFTIFLILNIVSLTTFTFLNNFIMNNFSSAANHTILYSFLWYINGIALILFLLFAFFDFSFIKHFIIEFKNALGISAGLSVVFYVLLTYSMKLWPFFSKIVAGIVYFLLRLVSKDAVYTLEKGVPSIGLPGVVAQIHSACSGIEGMGLFLLLFTALVIVEYKDISKNKLLVLYPAGVLGAFIVNIIRTFLLFIAGYFISPDFAIGAFHSNTGWILFTIYFLGFIYFAYPWMRKK